MPHPVLKVSSMSSPRAVAGYLIGMVREYGGAEIQAIGAGAVNQAVKGVAIARRNLVPDGVDLICAPEFTDVRIGDQDRTAMKLIVEFRVRHYSLKNR